MFFVGPRLHLRNLERAATSYKATAGLGCRRFHSKVLPDLSKEMRWNIVNFFKNEQCRRLPHTSLKDGV